MQPTSTEERKAAIEKLLYAIGGLEATILSAKENRDWDFVKQLQPLRKDYQERLRRVVYGLSEKRSSNTEE